MIHETITYIVESSITEDYYKIEPNMTIRDIHKRWVENGDKVYDESMPAMFPIRELWPIREYTWTRNTARGGKLRVGADFLEGPAKWDILTSVMQEHGWDKEEPAIVLLGANGKLKVGEGNHRLAIAMQLGIKEVPVRFEFYQTVTKSPGPESMVVVPAKEGKKAAKKILKNMEKAKEKVKDKRAEKELTKQVDELMDLLGWQPDGDS